MGGKIIFPIEGCRVGQFIFKHARTYLNYASLLETVLGGGTGMQDEYSNLTAEEHDKIVEWCYSAIGNYLIKAGTIVQGGKEGGND